MCSCKDVTPCSCTPTVIFNKEILTASMGQMGAALKRVAELENALRFARDYIKDMKGAIGPSAYIWSTSGSTTWHTKIEEKLVTINKVLTDTK